MFKKATVTLGEAEKLLMLMNMFLNGIDILPYKAARRFDRQVKKLSNIQKLISEAHQASLKEILGDEGYEKVLGEKPDAQLQDFLSKEQLIEFDELMTKERGSDYDGMFLSESFEFFFEDAEMPTKVGFQLSEIISFYEDNELWEVKE